MAGSITIHRLGLLELGLLSMDTRARSCGLISLLMWYFPVTNGTYPYILTGHRDEWYKKPECDIRYVPLTIKAVI